MNKHHHQQQQQQQQLQWFLVSNCGFSLPLHQTMISLGRENCDVILESQSADGKHAVITYDHYEKRFKVKDLNTINGTYLNENRIPVHTFVLLQHLDCLRFGFDAVIYQLQGIPRVYTGPSYSHYTQQQTSNNNLYYPASPLPPPRPSSWASPFISSPHIIISKMADCRGCECKQDVVGRFVQSSRESPETVEVVKGVAAQQPVVKQDYCGNHVVGPQPSNAVVGEGQSVADANRLKNGHLTTSTDCLSCSYAPSSLPVAGLSKDIGNSDGQLNGGGVNAKLAHRRSVSLEPISSERNDARVAVGHRESIIEACKKPVDRSVFGEDKKSAEMVVMEAEKPYVQLETKIDDVINNDEHGNGGCRPLSTAFTVEFADNRTASIASKRLDIKDSISKFAPPKPEGEMRAGHRRNLSLPKKENGKDQVWDLGNTHGLGPSKTQLKESLGFVRGGYLSEGHMSSDQDEELSAKSDPTRTPAIINDKDMAKVVGHSTATPVKHQEIKVVKNPGRRSLPVSGLRDSAKYLISRMFGEVTAPPSSPSDAPIVLSPGGPVSKLTLNNSAVSPGNGSTATNLKKGDVKNGSRSSLTSNTTYTVDGRELAGKSSQVVLPKSKLKAVEVEEAEMSEGENEEVEEEVEEEEDAEQGNVDNGSETGTYTIEKDEDNAAEVKEARKNIDVVFGLKNQVVQKQKSEEDEESRHSPEVSEEKTVKIPTPSKGNSSWLKDWAASSLDTRLSQSPLVVAPAHQAETRPTTVSINPAPWISANPSSQGSVPPFASSFSTSTTPEVPQRPRRRLPVIPTEKLSALPPSVHSNGMSNFPKTGGEAIRSFNHSNRSSPDDNRSDSTGMDTETILRETETVVSAMEARMDHQRLNQKERVGGRDSGGESDVDTSTASATNEVEVRPKKLLLHKKVAAQLKSQLKSLEDDPCYEARSLSPRALRRNVMGSLSSHGRTTPTDSVSEVETASIQSDISSSSELSGSSPGSKRKHRESAPLMRFNRAFSLRRARLGCESEASPHPPTSTKTAPALPQSLQPTQTQVNSSRPNSASSATSSKGRAAHLNSSNYSKSDSGSSSSAAVKKPASRPPPVSANNSFSRSDGGRFSLRLPRSAIPPARPSSAKTSTASTTPQPTPRVKSAGSNGRSGATPRSNSTLSAKELELKNWKRRKEYDPLKAAAEGRKKEAAVKKTTTVALSKSESPSPTSTTFHRSASFHGTDTMNGGAHLRRNTFSLDDDDNELCSPGYTIPAATHRHTVSDLECEVTAPPRGRSSRKSSEDELEATRTLSHTDLDAEPAMVSPRESPVLHLHPSIRHKNKVDALDNLVISTIHQLSCHLRSNAEVLLTKIRDSHGRNCEQALGAGGLSDLLERIALEDSPVSSPQGRSVSKQLSGILKNLKRLEESLHAVDRVFDTIPSAPNGQPHKLIEGSSHKRWNGFKDQDYY